MGVHGCTHWRRSRASLFSLCRSACYLVLWLASLEASGQLPNRVSQPIDVWNAVSLRSSALPHANVGNDLGPIDPKTRLRGLNIHFKLTPKQKDELDLTVDSQLSNGSSVYRKWLTLTEYARRFGASSRGIGLIEDWLEAQGFLVDRVLNSRSRSTATAGQVEAALETEFTIAAAKVSVSQGSSGTSTIRVSSVNSNTETFTFNLSTNSSSLEQNGCYNIPDAAVTANKTATTVLTIYTEKSSCRSSFLSDGRRHLFVASGSRHLSGLDRVPFGGAAIPISAGFVFAGSLLFGIRGRQAWLRGGLALILLTGLVELENSCRSGGTGSDEVAKGTYTLTLSGTDKSNSSITVSTDFIVTVQ